MLVNNVMRPVASNLLKVPSRSTSAVVGARSRHVSIPVSVPFFISIITNIFIFLRRILVILTFFFNQKDFICIQNQIEKVRKMKILLQKKRLFQNNKDQKLCNTEEKKI